MKLKLLKYDNLIDKLHEGVMILDNKYNIIYTNKYFKMNIFDISKKKVSIHDILDQNNFNIFKKSNKQLNKKNTVDCTLQLLNSNYILFSTKYISLNNDTYQLSLVKDINDTHKNKLIKNFLYNISEALYISNDLDSLYKEIHRCISDIANTNNFYIAIADWENNLINFPYFVDSKDKIPTNRTFSNGLTDYVIKTGKSLLCYYI